MHRAARRRFVALARLDPVYPVILHLAGRNLGSKRQLIHALR
jgi:hypothetical protein